MRCKAGPFKESGFVFTLNAVSEEDFNVDNHNTVVKGDSLVADELRQGLKAALEKLRAEQGHAPDWHPKSDDLVQDLVHPSMYPFVYGMPCF